MPVFKLQNNLNLYEFTTHSHKFRRLFCAETPVLNADFFSDIQISDFVWRAQLMPFNTIQILYR